MNKYKKIVNKLVDESFPVLRGKWILVIPIPLDFKRASAAFSYYVFFAQILVFKRAMKLDRKSLDALLVHELSHYEYLLKLSFLERIAFLFKWLFTKKWKAWFETVTDKNVIKKGYAHQLYNRVKYVEEKRGKELIKKRKKWGYLSSKEIKAYAQKIGKW